jgi:hypothetical protein
MTYSTVYPLVRNFVQPALVDENPGRSRRSKSLGPLALKRGIEPASVFFSLKLSRCCRIRCHGMSTGDISNAGVMAW